MSLLEEARVDQDHDGVGHADVDNQGQGVAPSGDNQTLVGLSVGSRVTGDNPGVSSPPGSLDRGMVLSVQPSGSPSPRLSFGERSITPEELFTCLDALKARVEETEQARHEESRRSELTRREEARKREALEALLERSERSRREESAAQAERAELAQREAEEERKKLREESAAREREAEEERKKLRDALEETRRMNEELNRRLTREIPEVRKFKLPFSPKDITACAEKARTDLHNLNTAGQHASGIENSILKITVDCLKIMGLGEMVNSALLSQILDGVQKNTAYNTFLGLWIKIALTMETLATTPTQDMVKQLFLAHKVKESICSLTATAGNNKPIQTYTVQDCYYSAVIISDNLWYRMCFVADANFETWFLFVASIICLLHEALHNESLQGTAGSTTETMRPEEARVLLWICQQAQRTRAGQAEMFVKITYNRPMDFPPHTVAPYFPPYLKPKPGSAVSWRDSTISSSLGVANCYSVRAAAMMVTSPPDTHCVPVLSLKSTNVPTKAVSQPTTKRTKEPTSTLPLLRSQTSPGPTSVEDLSTTPSDLSVVATL